MEAKNKQIIDVAIEMFSNKGFQQTTVQEIAEAAGVGKGTIYRFFESKEDLVSSLVEFAIDDVAGAVREAIREMSDPVEKLQTIITTEVDYYDQHRNLAKFLVREVLGYRSTFEAHVKQIWSKRGTLVEEVIRDGVASSAFKTIDPQTAAASLEGMILATVIYWFMICDAYPRQRIRDDIFTMVFDGMLTVSQ